MPASSRSASAPSFSSYGLKPSTKSSDEDQALETALDERGPDVRLVPFTGAEAVERVSREDAPGYRILAAFDRRARSREECRLWSSPR